MKDIKINIKGYNQKEIKKRIQDLPVDKKEVLFEILSEIAAREVKDYSSCNNLTGLYERFPSYSKEEIDYALSRRKEKEKELLQKCYGEALTDSLNPNLTKDGEIELKRIIKSINANLYYYKKHGKPRKMLMLNDLEGIYARFPSYSKEEIDYAISRINKGENLFLQKCYGEDLTDSLNPNLTEEETEKSKGIITKIRVYLSQYRKNGNVQRKTKNKDLITLYEKFPTYSKEEVDYGLSRIKKEEFKFLQKCYGEGLTDSLNPNLTEEETEKLKKIIAKVRVYLSQYRKNGNMRIKESTSNLSQQEVEKEESPKMNSLMELLKVKGYAEVSILIAIKKLSATEQELLAKRYGDNFDDYCDESFDELEEKILLKTLQKIEYELEGIEKTLPLSIYEYNKLSVIRKKYIDLAISYLDTFEKEFLKQCFSENLLTYKAPQKAVFKVDKIIQKIYYLIIAIQIEKTEEENVKLLGQVSYEDLIDIINNKLPSNYKFYLNGIISQKLGKDLTDQETNNLRKIYAEIMNIMIVKKVNTRKKEK